MQWLISGADKIYLVVVERQLTFDVNKANIMEKLIKKEFQVFEGNEFIIGVAHMNSEEVVQKVTLKSKVERGYYYSLLNSAMITASELFNYPNS